MKRGTWQTFFVAVLMLALAQQTPAHADAIGGSVSLDTSSLSGLFELVVILTDGGGTGDANNTLTLNNVLFGAGGNAGTFDALISTGGASGDLNTVVTLVDSSFLNIFASSFVPGSLLTFDFSLTPNLDTGGTPDQFSLALLRSDGAPVNTEDPSGANSLLTVNVDSANPVFGTFASDLTPAPLVTQSAAVPEPPSLLLLAMGLGALWSARMRKPQLHIPPTGRYGWLT